MNTAPVKPIMLVSACLVGCPARYDGTIPETPDKRLHLWLESGLVLPFCPETAGGLSIPRPPAEISGGTGKAVLAGEGRVFTRTGVDVTANFISGARLALAAIRQFAIHTAVLKNGSPSCGTTRIHDGCFQGQQVPGQGVTAALLAGHNVALYSENSLAQMDVKLPKEI